MKHTKIIVQIILVLAIVGAVVYYKYLRSETHKIKKQLIALCDDASKNSEEGNTSAAIKVVAMQNRLADHVDISVHGVPISGGYSCEELVSSASRARMFLETLKISVLEQDVTIDGNKANIDCVIHAIAATKTDRIDENYHMVISLVKDEHGKWLFTAFKETDIMQK
ncbi:MAG: hypothetical protein MJ106_06180 [Lentisphaeria bacterium]|nr:hypothetical protein [Lentisphaeria bacterium]